LSNIYEKAKMIYLSDAEKYNTEEDMLLSAGEI
jgi:hypothetical protein